jgi:biopolymer transport protein ExbD
LAFQPDKNTTPGLNAEINIIPLVDIMLVLLIIFMVAAPLMNHAVDIRLPKAATKEADVKEESVRLEIRKDQTISIGGTATKIDELAKRLDIIFNNREKKEILISADEQVTHGFIIKVMAIAQNAGIVKISFLTDPTK